ncbi:MAG: hypothetical protein NZ108_11135, partial [Bacteroidia bacterium]|nr:hypothetical protein [Bacteroidia bacterium]
QFAKSQKNLKATKIQSTIAKVLLEAEDKEAIDYVLQIYPTLGESFEKFAIVQDLATYLVKADEDEKKKGLPFLMDVAKNNPVWWLRLSGTRALLNFDDRPEVKQFLKELKAKETHPQLKDMYQKQLNVE